MNAPATSIPNKTNAILTSAVLGFLTLVFELLAFEALDALLLSFVMLP